MVRSIAVLAFLFCVASLRAETVAWAETNASCTRPALQSAVDKYLDALQKGDPSSMSIWGRSWFSWISAQ